MPRYSYIQIFHFNYFRVIDHFPYSILSTLRIFKLRSYGGHFEEGSWEHGRPNAGSKQKLASALCFTRAALCFMQATAHAAAVPGKGRDRRFSFGRIKMLFSEKFSQKIHRRLMYLVCLKLDWVKTKVLEYVVVAHWTIMKTFCLKNVQHCIFHPGMIQVVLQGERSVGGLMCPSHK